MTAAIHDETKFSELFMAYLLTRNSRIEEDLIDQLFNSSERRLARLLLLSCSTSILPLIIGSAARTQRNRCDDGRQ
jgi:hypothetical protein